MDTRAKILTLEDARRLRRPVAALACAFNVLRAVHARQIAAWREAVAGHTLLAIVLPVTPELLPRRARAELLAGLRSVQWVTVADAIEPFDAAAVLRLTESDVLDRVRHGGAC
jgi:hypothetical protein